MHNLLTESLIRFDSSSGGRIEASLPKVYAALMEDAVEAFPALRPHQRHAWHAFLVQLGAMAMYRVGMSEPPSSAGDWEALIRNLTPDYPTDEPWQLVVDDITKPAFMQPPARSKDRNQDYKSAFAAPDKLDMLVTSKNHDLKSAVAARANVDDWIFALVTLQTMEGYGGRYKYGISRMPSGYGNRPAFSLTPSASHGPHVKHDLLALMHHRSSLLKDYEVTDSGIGLLWVSPWDGTEAEKMQITRLEPFYIEVCRRVRLQWRAGSLVAAQANSDDKRISDVKGLTGDPWAPVSNNQNAKGTPPAFLTQRRFGYERVVDGMFSPDWKPPVLLRPVSLGGTPIADMQLVARGMVRGEGGTAGYHERVIPLRHGTLQVFGRAGGIKETGDIARRRIEGIGKVQNILRHAVSAFTAGGKTEGIADQHRARANQWINRLNDIVDADFFGALQDEVESEHAERDSVYNEWLRGVVDSARVLLQEATDSLPCPAIHRYRARVKAERLFEGRLRRPNGLPFLFGEEEKESEE